MSAFAVVAAAVTLAAPPPFEATVTPLSPEFRARMTSWRPGCPVPPRDLRLLTVTHWGFDARTRTGRLVVHADAAVALRRVMQKLYERRFPIRRMVPVEAYGSSDDRSMAADNTSAFNCRFVEGTSRWSEHAYGRAIDVNPRENPYVRGSHVSPPAGRAFVDRSRWAQGMIHARDAVVRAFAQIGWEWGGYWRSVKDYQHFSASGR
jgi:hypothetical protein